MRKNKGGRKKRKWRDDVKDRKRERGEGDKGEKEEERKREKVDTKRMK